MDSQIRIEDLKYKKFREEIADMPEEKLIHEFYQKTLLCDENEQIMEKNFYDFKIYIQYFQNSESIIKFTKFF